MGIIFEAMTAFFERDDWPVTRMGDDPALSATVRGDNGYWACVAQAVEAQRLFLFYSASPLDVLPDRRAPVAEFVTRANYGTLLGNFELNLEDGDLRYKTSLSVQQIPDETLREDDLLHRLIRQLVYTNTAMMDRYLPGIKAVLEDDMAPAEAIALVEG